MSRPKFQSAIASLACSFALVASANVPAQAGIFSFLGRHLFGSSHNQKRKFVHHRSVHSVIVHRTPSQPIYPAGQPDPSFAQAPYRVTLSNSGSVNGGDPDSSALFHNSDSPDTLPATTTPFPFRNPKRVRENNDQAFSTRASWYGPGFQGKRTASGEWFNQYGLTAASRTLPLGSKLLVANPKTGKCCTVTINDRGPYVTGRDIDLSHGAAARIGVTGVSPVICVAYANSQEAKQIVSRHGRRYRTSEAPAKIDRRVMHLMAGVS